MSGKWLIPEAPGVSREQSAAPLGSKPQGLKESGSMTKRILGISALLAGVPLMTFFAGSAHASCAIPPPLEAAINMTPDVFVGSVIDLESRGRWATVQVEEVWKGEEIPAEVEVRAGPRQVPGSLGTSATSVDRHFDMNERYIFIPYKRNGSIFRDNACTRTSLFRPRFERFRPASLEEGERAPNDHEVYGPELTLDPEKDDTPKLLFLGVIAAAVLGGAGWLVYRRARRSS